MNFGQNIASSFTIITIFRFYTEAAGYKLRGEEVQFSIKYIFQILYNIETSNLKQIVHE